MDALYYSPPLRQNSPCGFDHDLSAGRAPSQMGWYNLIGKNHRLTGMDVLDVGCGMGDGVIAMREGGCKSATGQDSDSRLNNIDPQFITKDVSEIADKSYDCITCFDVIEHVIDDKLFFDNLCRITRNHLFITTPNYTRSKAQNHCHCREYTIPQFCAYFKPDELWSGAPDGWSHITKLLSKTVDGYIDHTRNDVEIKGALPEDYSFTHSTVDGLEWGHILGIFNVTSLK